MTEVLFYHLERTTLEAVLPELLEKTLQRGWRAVVRSGARDKVEALDSHLWTYRDESFLPHAAGGDGATQPVWLTDGFDTPNEANVVFLTDGVFEELESLGRFERCVLIFNGRDEDAKKDARAYWKKVKEAGHEAAYWRQSFEGRWEKAG